MLLHNPGFCISEHIKNQYRATYDKDLCFIWSNPLSINLFHSGDLVHGIDAPPDNRDICISGTNFSTIENFSSNANFILRLYHTNKKDEIAWLAKQSAEGIKFLVKIVNPLFDWKNKPALTQSPVLAIASFDQLDLNEPDFCPFEKNISVQLTDGSTLRIKGNEFNALWLVDGNENYCANRYMLIPPSFNSQSQYVKEITRVSLLNQIRILSGLTSSQGINLLQNLKSALLNGDEIKRHTSLFENYKTSNLEDASIDFGRAGFSDSLQSLRERDVIEVSDALIDSYLHAGKCWGEIFEAITNNSNFSAKEIIDFYDLILDAEKKGISTLQKCINNTPR